MTTGRKLALLAMVVVGVTVYMAFVGASTSWQYYLSVDQCLAEAKQLSGSRLRVSGKVVEGSLQVSADRARASFSLEGSDDDLQVVCSGPLPDNLAEGIEVVVEGQLESSGLLRGHKLLTRCASKYESDGPVDTHTARSPSRKSHRTR